MRASLTYGLPVGPPGQLFHRGGRRRGRFGHPGGSDQPAAGRGTPAAVRVVAPAANVPYTREGAEVRTGGASSRSRLRLQPGAVIVTGRRPRPRPRTFSPSREQDHRAHPRRARPPGRPLAAPRARRQVPAQLARQPPGRRSHLRPDPRAGRLGAPGRGSDPRPTGGRRRRAVAWYERLGYAKEWEHSSRPRPV